jgi:hypothetical protein
MDPTELTDTEESTYKLIPITSLGALPVANATERMSTVGDRMHLPTRPANVIFDGQSGFTASWDPADVTATVSWSNRNRVTETASVLAWGAANVTGEVGQLTKISFYLNGVLLETVTATVDATFFDWDSTGHGLTTGDELEVIVSATRNGFASFQTTKITVDVL